MRRTRRAAALVAAIALGAPRAARAEGDGIYGRFDGDLDLSVGAGPAVAAGGLAAGAAARALYLGTAGLVGTWVDALGADRSIARSLSLAVEVRPLFLARWGTDRERGPARLDLALDSIALAIGPAWTARRGGSLGAAAIEVAGSLEVPLAGRATGPWIGARGALRFPSDDFGAGGSLADRGAELLFTLAWHQVVSARLVDPGDALLR